MIKKIVISNKTIIEKIYVIRGQKVMLDKDLANFYSVKTKRLKEQVRRNINRFPESFMFELTTSEYDILRSQFATLKRGRHSKYLPFAFTEYGILMLSGILNSEMAIKISIHIIETFVQLRKILNNYEEIRVKLEKMNSKYKEEFGEIYRILHGLIEKPKEKPRQRIGYKK